MPTPRSSTLQRRVVGLERPCRSSCATARLQRIADHRLRVEVVAGGDDLVVLALNDVRFHGS